MTKPVPELALELRPVAGKFVLEAAYGPGREIAAFGARGDGKTFSALIAMILHAKKHKEEGFDLPVPWIGVTDYFTSHKLKTLRTLESPIWCGGWKIMDGGHKAIFRLGRQDLVALDLFGIEDQGAMDRVRMETVGVWFEEPAPSTVLVQSAGISESSWLLALTSQRIPSYKHPALITSNYPDEDHWTWQRFVLREAPGTTYFRIPPGERASPAQREEWRTALKDRPDLLRRLLDGEPGLIILGPQVAQGFIRDVHVADDVLLIHVNEPIILGFDFGHTPACVLGQEWRGFVHVFAGFYEQHAGTRQLITNQVKPWLSKFAPWSLSNNQYLAVGYDPSGNTEEQADIDSSPIRVIRELLGGHAIAGPTSWTGRKDPLLALLNRMNRGVPALRISKSPHTKDLISALDGRWYYPQDRMGNVSRDLPKKPNHPWEDIGDAVCYLVNRVQPQVTSKQYKPIEREIADSVLGY